MENTFRVQLRYVYYKYLMYYKCCCNLICETDWKCYKNSICFREVNTYNLTMLAFLRATQKLGLKAGPEMRLSVRMLSRTAPAGNEAMPLPTHDKVESLSFSMGRLIVTTIV